MSLALVAELASEKRSRTTKAALDPRSETIE
jgi:hypothetical protein